MELGFCGTLIEMHCILYFLLNSHPFIPSPTLSPSSYSLHPSSSHLYRHVNRVDEMNRFTRAGYRLQVLPEFDDELVDSYIDGEIWYE